jgi:hypothetical protein
MDAKQLIDVAESDDVCVRVAPEGAAFVLNLSKPAVAFLIRKAALVPVTQGKKGTFHFPLAGLDVVVEYEAMRATVDDGGHKPRFRKELIITAIGRAQAPTLARRIRALLSWTITLAAFGRSIHRLREWLFS